MSTREKVIAALENARGSFVSGEMLAEQCHVSRNAIWKSIAELKKSGYAIRSVNNRGYMLEEDSDVISKTGILMYLESLPGEPWTGSPDSIQVHDVLDSTNNEAKRSLLFSDGRMAHGTVIIARQQSAGRGHGGSSFFSPEGGIYMSLILEPEKIRNKTASVSESAVSAVSRVIEGLFNVVTERRKNSSLYVGDEKVCGILTEGICDLETGVYSNYIVGAGIRAGRLHTLGDGHPQKNEIIASLIREMDI